MNVIFFGTSEFAVSAFSALLASRHKILAVVCAPDKGKGRGQIVSLSPIKALAKSKNLPILQPANLREPQFIQFLKAQAPDLFIVCAYGKILTKEVLAIPLKYAINLHGSLLPKYRGAAPINWAIINGERQSGVTLFKMDEYMDKGEVLLRKSVEISLTDTSVTLAEKLARLSGAALIEALDLIEQGKAVFSKQDESQVSFAPKLKKEDGLIDWASAAWQIHNRIRGLAPWPGAFTYLGGKLLKIWESKVIAGQNSGAPGEIVEADSKKGLLITTGQERLLITVLQLAGKRKMSAGEFILGHRVKAGERLEEKWLK